VYWLIPWCALALALAWLPSQAYAQVTLEARLGLQGTLRLGKWNLITVQVHNAGGPLHGTLGVRTWLGSESRGDVHSTLFTRPLALPPGARKRLTFAVPITSIADPVDVSLWVGDQVLAQQRLDLREALHAEQIILGLTRDVSLDFLATAFPKTHTRIVYLPPADLPVHWSGYDSVSAVVVKGISLQALSDTQYTALQAWLANGGILIAAGDAQYTLLQEPRLRALLPVHVLGVQAQEGLPALAERYATPLPDSPMVLARARLTRGRVLIGTDEMPLLAHRPFGKGRVVFLAVDYAMPPLPGWSGQAALWKDILQIPEHVDFVREFAELGMLDESHPIMKLFGRPVLTFPSHLTLSAILLTYLSLLTLLFWRMSRRPQQCWRYWGGVAVLIIVCTAYALSPFLEHGLNQDALLFDVTTMELPADTGYAHVQGHVGLFAIRGGQFEIPLQQADTVLRHTFTRGAGKAGKEFEASVGEGFRLRRLGLEAWTLRVFSTESMIAAPVQVVAEGHTTGLTVQVENRSSVPLQGTLVAYQGRVFALGAIAPGEKFRDELYPVLQSTDSAQEMAWRVMLKRRPGTMDTRLAYLQEVLLQQYFGDKRLADTSDTPVLTGWLLAPTTLGTPPAATAMQGVTLVVSRPLL